MSSSICMSFLKALAVTLGGLLSLALFAGSVYFFGWSATFTAIGMSLLTLLLFFYIAVLTFLAFGSEADRSTHLAPTASFGCAVTAILHVSVVLVRHMPDSHPDLGPNYLTFLCEMGISYFVSVIFFIVGLTFHYHQGRRTIDIFFVPSN